MTIKRLILALIAGLVSCAAYAVDCIPSGVVDQFTYFVAVDATDFTTRETGLTTFTVRRSRNGGASAAFTTPTINETDVTNMPGVYELLLDEDMTIDAGDDVQHMTLHITHAGMAPITKEICIARPKITVGNTLGVASDGDALEVNALTGHTAQTGDAFARLGAPAGASVSADVAAVKADTAATLDDTGTSGVLISTSSSNCRAPLGCSATGTLNGTHSSTTADLGTNAPGATSDMVGKTLVIPAKFFARAITAYDTGTGIATFDSTSLTLANADVWYLWETAPGSGGGGLDAAGVRAAVGLASANLDTQLADIPTVSEFNARTVTSATYATAPALQTVDDNVDAVLVDTAEIGTAGAGLTAVDDAMLAAIEQTARADAAIVNCTVNTGNFAGSTTTVACILTDRDAGAITAASGDLEGRELLILSGAQIYEGRFINDTTWDGANSELQLTLSRALPGTLADAVTAIIR